MNHMPSSRDSEYDTLLLPRTTASESLFTMQTSSFGTGDSAGARVRKAFHYPGDNDDAPIHGIDEEGSLNVMHAFQILTVVEQVKVIARLVQQDAQTRARYQVRSMRRLHCYL